MEERLKKFFDNKTVSRVVLIIGACAIIVGILAIVLNLNAGGIHLSEYFYIEVEGVNGSATAKVVNTADRNSLARNFNDFATMSAVYDFFEDIEWEISKEDNISNGDKITAKATYDSQALKNIDIKLSGDTISLKVYDLEDGIEVDPFDYLDISYEGAHPYAEIKLENNSTDKLYSKISFSADKDENISNNDEITITASISKDYNVVFSSSEKTITVKDIGEYVLNANQLSDDQLDTLKSESLEHLNKVFQSEYYEYIFTYLKPSRFDAYEVTSVSNSDPVFNSAYLAAIESSFIDNYEPGFFVQDICYNQVTVVFDLSMTGYTGYRGDSFESRNGYISIKYNDVIVNADGSISYNQIDVVEETSSWQAASEIDGVTKIVTDAGDYSESQF